jgi:hypothetical protein
LGSDELIVFQITSNYYGLFGKWRLVLEANNWDMDYSDNHGSRKCWNLAKRNKNGIVFRDICWEYSDMHAYLLRSLGY